MGRKLLVSGGPSSDGHHFLERDRSEEAGLRRQA